MSSCGGPDRIGRTLRPVIKTLHSVGRLGAGGGRIGGRFRDDSAVAAMPGNAVGQGPSCVDIHLLGIAAVHVEQQGE